MHSAPQTTNASISSAACRPFSPAHGLRSIMSRPPLPPAHLVVPCVRNSALRTSCATLTLCSFFAEDPDAPLPPAPPI
ncbi:hypothetical protein Micbo1qcDRAFT_167733, partial [Microdochium bolleyi]